MWQLRPQNRRLESIDSLAESEFIMFIFGNAAVVAQLAHPGQERFIVAGYRSGVAVSSEVLARIEAKASQIADAPTALSLVLGGYRLRGVLDQYQSVAVGDVLQRF